jgi:hypothetical protein
MSLAQLMAICVRILWELSSLINFLLVLPYRDAFVCEHFFFKIAARWEISLYRVHKWTLSRKIEYVRLHVSTPKLLLQITVRGGWRSRVCTKCQDNLIFVATRRDSSVSGYGPEDRRSIDWFFVTLSRPALGPTQPPMQWVPEALISEIKRLGHEAIPSSPSIVGVNSAWAIPLFLIHFYGVVLNYAHRLLYSIGPLTRTLYQIQIDLFRCWIRF